MKKNMIIGYFSTLLITIIAGYFLPLFDRDSMWDYIKEKSRTENKIEELELDLQVYEDEISLLYLIENMNREYLNFRNLDLSLELYFSDLKDNFYKSEQIHTPKYYLDLVTSKCLGFSEVFNFSYYGFNQFNTFIQELKVYSDKYQYNENLGSFQSYDYSQSLYLNYGLPEEDILNLHYKMSKMMNLLKTIDFERDDESFDNQNSLNNYFDGQYEIFKKHYPDVQFYIGSKCLENEDFITYFKLFDILFYVIDLQNEIINQMISEKRYILTKKDINNIDNSISVIQFDLIPENDIVPNNAFYYSVIVIDAISKELKVHELKNKIINISKKLDVSYSNIELLFEDINTFPIEETKLDNLICIESNLPEYNNLLIYRYKQLKRMLKMLSDDYFKLSLARNEFDSIIANEELREKLNNIYFHVLDEKREFERIEKQIEFEKDKLDSNKKDIIEKRKILLYCFIGFNFMALIIFIANSKKSR